MAIKFFAHHHRLALGLVGIIILFCSLATLPLPWNETAEDAVIDLQFKLRGARSLSDNIVLVFIGAEDVQALGGWPITRDYYGYLTHVLSRAGAKVIGFDLLFDSPDRHYPEFDTMLADFFRSAGNVCLPVAFSELTTGGLKTERPIQRTSSMMSGHHPIFPSPEFRKHLAGLGFSNFTKEPVGRKAPLVAAQGDSFMLSFGAELTRLYLGGLPTSIEISARALRMADAAGNRYSFPIDHRGRMRLNHFGDIDHISAVGFVDLLQAFEASPDSINLAGKLVIVAVTAPGISTLKATPLAVALPASLIHATVAENLIQQNYLRSVPAPIHWLLIVLMAIAAWLIWQAKRMGMVAAGSIITLLLLWITAMVIFSQANLVLPLFYPTLACLASFAYAGVRRSRQRQALDASMQKLLAEQITIKEMELEKAKHKLAELHHQLHSNATLSEQTRQLAEERERAILALEKQLRDLQTCVVPETRAPQIQFSEIIHDANSKLAQVLALVAKVAADDIPVLLLGETGTGKEMIARAIHQTSQRRNAAFVATNCGALPETLLESELFGHEKGSFTGAHSRRRGRFELADGGTIFLDEISETTPAFQARLLRVLQEGTFERVGGEQTIKVDVRVIAASSRNLQEAVERENFRSDLFYRLNGFPITLPPLRERPEDIPLLAARFLKKHGYHSISGFSDRVMEILQGYHWPGNVRELENVVRRTAILAQSEGRRIIQANDLPEEIIESKSSPAMPAAAYKPFEEQILEMLRALKFSHAAISQTAKALGNRDRGTITEYFRGLCFEHLVNNDYNVEAAAKAIAGTNDEQIVERVQAKIDSYLQNLRSVPVFPEGDEHLESRFRSQYKGLPKKYLPYLQQVIAHVTQTASLG